AALVATTRPGVRARRLVRPLVAAGVSLWALGLPLMATAAAARHRPDGLTVPVDGVEGQVRLSTGDVEGYLAVVAVALFVVPLLDSLRGADGADGADGGSGLGGSTRRGRAWLAWLGAAAGTAAVWLALADAGVSVPEAFTLPSSALLLVAGTVVLVAGGRGGASPVGPGPRRLRAGFARPGSVVVLGPALAMALLPSALVAFTEAVDRQAPTRGVATVAACVVVVVAGARLHLRAPLFVGLAALVIAAVGQVFTVYDVVPRWVALALAGAVLVGAGFSFEALAATGRRVRGYADELH
ncbi:MAG: hypothetical protein M3Y71_11605, partial [Actinomycetota bacterium]|nr:hypothetical protein [Actinomycetota bacterium]